MRGTKMKGLSGAQYSVQCNLSRFFREMLFLRTLNHTANEIKKPCLHCSFHQRDSLCNILHFFEN